MMDCCDSIEDLGCFQSCDIVEIGVLAAQTGLYTIELQPQGTQIFQTTNTAGTPLIFSNGFNEDGVSVFKIKQPDGTYLTVDGSECFQIQNSVAKNPVLADTIIIPIDVDCNTTYNVYVGGVLRATGTIDCSVNNTLNIYPN